MNTRFSLVLLFSFFMLTACGGGGGGGSDSDSSTSYKSLGLSNVIQIESYGAGGATFFLKSDGSVYILDTYDLNNDKIVTLNLLSGLSNITKISAGNDHLLALDANGNVYGYGDNSMGQLGLNRDTQSFYTSVQAISALSGIVDISTGYNFSVVVDINGNVYSFGEACNSYYNCSGGETQLGFYDSNDDQYFDVPTQVTSLSNIVAVESGNVHTIAIDANGYVYTFGMGDNGRLGQGDTLNQTLPKKVDSLSNIKKVSAGANHTLVLDNNNKVYGFGDGVNGELSLGNYATDEQSDPIEIKTVSNIVDIAAGDEYSLFLDNAGHIFSSGLNNVENRLGFADEYELFQAKQLSGLSGVIKIGSGLNNSFFVDSDSNVKATYDPPVTVATSSDCGDANLIGTWVRAADKVSVTFTQYCTATIIQESVNGYDATLKTYLTGIVANGSSMNYTISKMVYIDGFNKSTQTVGESYTGVPYSISGNSFVWGGYTYSRQ